MWHIGICKRSNLNETGLPPPDNDCVMTKMQSTNVVVHGGGGGGGVKARKVMASAVCVCHSHGG